MLKRLAFCITLSLLFTSLNVGAGLAQPEFNLSFTVNTLSDERDASIDDDPLNGADGICATPSGGCSLRAAIEEANEQAGAVSITFGVTGTITYIFSMPSIEVPVTIESPLNNGAPQVALDGSNINPTTRALNLQGGSSEVRGLSIVNIPGNGIVLSGDNNIIENNYFGVYPDGVTVGPNQMSGVAVISSGNTITSNLISGNESTGILILSDANNNLVQDNLIGTNAAGTTAIPNRFAGIRIRGDNNSIINNLISGNETYGIQFGGTSAPITGVIQGNLIGTDITGNVALGNVRAGIYVDAEVGDFLIGGDTEAQRNIISGNGYSTGITLWAGVDIGIRQTEETGSMVIRNNFIGTNITGDAALPNAEHGISIQNSDENGPLLIEHNVISGNGTDGINIFSSDSLTTIRANFIGVNQAGDPIPNGRSGIDTRISGSVLVGGNDDNDKNYIAYNLDSGIGESGFAAPGKRYLSNAIYANGGLGIDIGYDAQPDAGFPILNDITSANGQITISGEIDSDPNTLIRLDFYSNSACDPSGYGEGENWLGFRELTTDGNGNATFSYAFQSASGFITATATNLVDNTTSEFSECAGGTSAGNFPVGLSVSGALDVAPVLPVFQWTGVENTTTYSIYVQTNGLPVIFEDFEAGDVCSGLVCAVDSAVLLADYGLASGDYQWWVGADGQWSGQPSYDPATFVVDVPAPATPTNITGVPNQGRPGVTWDDDPNTLWVQVWIGPGTFGAYFTWHGREGYDTFGLPTFSCAADTCALDTTWDTGSGTYAIWMQGWGPGGLSDWDSGELTLPDVTASVPSNLAITDASAANPEFTWVSGANSTWYEVVIAPDDDAWTWPLAWVDAASINCADAGQTCTYAPPMLNGAVLPDGNYVLRVRAWGPGGLSDYAEVSFAYSG